MITSELTVIHSCQIQRFFKVKLKLRLHIFGPKSYKNDHSASYVAGFTGFPDLDMYCATSPTSTYLSSLFLELKLHTTYIQATTKKKIYFKCTWGALQLFFFQTHFCWPQAKCQYKVDYTQYGPITNVGIFPGLGVLYFCPDFQCWRS